MRRILLVLLIAAGVGLAFWQIQNSRSLHLEEQTRLMMGTYVTIYAQGPKKITSPAINLAFQRMKEVETKFDIHNPESPLYAFNHQGIPIRDQEILNLIRVALEVSRESEGAFDITIYPLVKLWKFYGDSPHLPSEEEIKDCLKGIDYQHLVFTNGGLKADKENINIDLGAIAKGYAVSQAVEVLKAEGVNSALIDAGGDVYALGNKNGEPWKVGIQDPRSEGLLGYLEVTDMAVTGSGDYERFFIKEGRRYHHIFNPKTGYPAEDLSGVTVIYPEPSIADAWATALFVLGPEKGLEMVERIPAMETIMITKQGEILYSSGLLRDNSESKNKKWDVLLLLFLQHTVL